MARTGDEEREGQEAEKGGRRLTLRFQVSIFQIRLNILPFLPTCTLYFACTQFVVQYSAGLVFTPLL